MNTRLWLVFAILLPGFARLEAETIKKVSLEVRDETVGVSPQIMGVNIGHFVKGGDAMEGLERLGVNGVRIFLNLKRFLAPLAETAAGSPVKTEADFLKLRQQLREHPQDSGLIDWTRFANHWEKMRLWDGNKIDAAWAFQQLRAAKIDILMQATCSPGTIAFKGSGDWQNRWEFWRGYFAVARFFAEHYGVERFQMYNEPNLGPLKNNKEDYIERLRLASDAIQSAFHSLGGNRPEALQPKIYAPVTAQFREDWAKAVLAVLNTPRFPGGPVPVFQIFAYQSYDHAPKRFREKFLETKELLAKSPGAGEMPIALTEFNVFTNRNFFEKNRSLDEPEVYSRLGGIYTSLISVGTRELYVFKFSQTDGKDDIGIRRNGLFLVDNENSPYPTGRLTGGGEVVALFSGVFKNGTPLLRLDGSKGLDSEKLHALAASDPGQRSLHLALVNEEGQAVEWDIVLPASLVSPWQKITLRSVEGEGGKLVETGLKMDQQRRLKFSQAAQSVCMIAIE